MSELQVIINSAASVNFIDPLPVALQINYFGALRILDLAHECRNLIALHHVSTTGVNYNLLNSTVAKEEIYPWIGGENWESEMEKLA